MEKFQIQDEPEMIDKIPNSIEDLLINLTKKIDQLANQINSMERKLDKLSFSGSKNTSEKNEVEIEEQNELDEDYLTPTDLIFEKDVIKLSGMKLISFRIATASEIADVTKRDRAVESLYLNDLWSRNKVRKLRIGRKIYFYAGRLTEIKPFKNSAIKPEWRDILICIIRDISTFNSNKTLKLEKLVKNYISLIQSDGTEILPMDTEKRIRIEKNIREILDDIVEGTNFIEYHANDDKFIFLVDEWLQLGV